MATMQPMASQDPVFEALGLMNAANQQAASEQEWMAALAYQQGCTPYDCTYTDPNQLAWCQAQAMMATAWHLNQMATWQAASLDPGLAALTQGHVDSSYLSLPPGLPATTTGATTPRGSPTVASDATPIKTILLASEVSTAPGSPSGDTETSEEERLENVGQCPLKELGIPPPPPTPTKLDLHAIIFEKAKDPISSHLLQLIKGSEADSQGQEKGKALLDLLRESDSAAAKPRNGPLASGSHRHAAVAARAAAAKAAAEAEAEEAPARRRRPPGGRGGRSNRGASNN